MKGKERPGRCAVAGVLKKTVYAAAVAAGAAVLLVIGAAGGAHAETQTDVKGGIDQRRVIDPATYGDIVMNLSASGGVKRQPVVFKHWTHRTKYTCNVCHTDLAFPLKANTVNIKQSEIEAGKYCGACHDGKTAFGAFECDRCHSYGTKTDDKKMDDLLAELSRPEGKTWDGFGNRVNWVAAMREGGITPASALPGKPVNVKKEVKDGDVVIPVTKYAPHPSDVVFPHKAHTEQIHCSSCHPAPFVGKAGANPQMNMIKIISGQYCGMCHDRVSFPLNDCFRCHSQPVPRPEEAKKKDETEKKEDTTKTKPKPKRRR